MKTGDKVRVPDGGIETISEMKDDLIGTEESLRTGSWYGKEDVVPVVYSETLKRFVAIPV